MKPLIVVMLCVQVLFFCIAVWTVLKAKAVPERGRPLWSRLSFSLILAALVSIEIADKHRGPDGELLQFGAGVLLGMAILSLLVLLRQRLGTDAAA